MNAKLVLAILMSVVFTLPIVGEELTGISEKLDELVQKANSEPVELGNAKPDKKLTSLLSELSDEMTKLSAIMEEYAETESDKRRELTELLVTGDELFLLLEERRYFRYLLWAEICLRRCDSSDLSKLLQRELFDLYKCLSDINLSLISEVILSREITTRLAMIYERLDVEHKPEARLESIRRNADGKMAEELGFDRRKGLNDF